MSSIDYNGLNDYHFRKAIPAICRALMRRTSASDAITTRLIIESMKKRGYEIRDKELSECIRYIRNNPNLIQNYGLISGNSGYYLSNNPEEIKACQEKLFGRIKTQKETADSLYIPLNTWTRIPQPVTNYSEGITAKK